MVYRRNLNQQSANARTNNPRVQWSSPYLTLFRFRNWMGKFPKKKLEIIEFPQSEPFSRTYWRKITVITKFPKIWVYLARCPCVRKFIFSVKYLWTRSGALLRWLTTVLTEYKSTTFNSFEKGPKLFLPSLFTVCLSLLPFCVKFEQLNVNKWPKWATEYPVRDWGLVC